MKSASLWIALSVLMLSLIACQPEEIQLPTLARLPDIAPPADSTSTPIEVAQDSSRATLPPINTATATATASATAITSETPTFTPSATITDTPTVTPTDLPTLDPQVRAITSLLEIAQQATVLPSDFVVPAYEGIDIAPPAPVPFSQGGSNPPTLPTLPPPAMPNPPTSVCQFFPSGGFALVFANNPDVASQIGCPLGNPPDAIANDGAYQPFEGGFMVWTGGDIYVFHRTGSSLQRYADTFTEGIDPQTSAETAPSGLVTPVRGFLKVWANNPDVRASLGWGLSAEQGTLITVQAFLNGRMIWFPLRADILVLIGTDTGTWRSFSGRF